MSSRAEKLLENLANLGPIPDGSAKKDKKKDGKKKDDDGKQVESKVPGSKADAVLRPVDEREVRIHSNTINGGIGNIRCSTYVPHEIQSSSDIQNNGGSSAHLAMFTSYENGPVFVRQERLSPSEIRKLEAGIEVDLRKALAGLDKQVEAIMKKRGYKLAN